MYILGLGGSDHDISAALLKDGRIISAIEEERITRKKYGFNSNLLFGKARKYVLNTGDVNLKDVDCVVIDEILPKTAYFSVHQKKNIVNHHLLHAASAFYPSSFDEAAILVVDNAGSLVSWKGKEGIETVTYAYGNGNSIEVMDKVIGEKYHIAVLKNNEAYQKGDPDNSLGYFYKIISHFCGFNFIVNEDFYFTEDGKTMGLASYGTDKYWKLLRPFIELLDNGQILIDLRSGKFEEVLKDITREPKSGAENLARCADIAWAGQKILEEALIHAAQYLYERTKSPNLCIAGGVGLNSVANGKILKDTPFKQLFVQPASGDGGTALGAALWGYYGIYGMERKSRDSLQMKNAYLGRTYSEDEILEAIKRFDAIKFERPGNLTETTARLIADGKIIGWFQGGSEYGPRALGHRSILVNPTMPHMKDYLNSRVKFREGFRPFAPSVLYEYQTEYFDLEQYSPFMLIVADVKEDKKSVLPAITHVDGTARLQSITREAEGLYYDLIFEFMKITGVPVVLNTSFNIKGEPIVETPTDALKCFTQTNIDYLTIGPFLVSKE